MRIIRNHNIIAKEPIRCSYCNELIEVGDKYKELTYTLNVKGKIVACKENCHLDCSVVAHKLGMYELPKITSHSFIKNVRAYILELYAREKMKMTKNEIDQKSIKALIDVIVQFHDDLEAEANPKVSRATSKECYELSKVLFMIPNIVDDLVDALKEEDLYTESARRFTNNLTKEYELATDVLWRVNNNEVRDIMCKAGFEIYEYIENSITLEGVERYANILHAVLMEVSSKYQKIDSELNTKASIGKTQQLIKRLEDTINFTPQPFVRFVVNKASSNK